MEESFNDIVNNFAASVVERAQRIVGSTRIVNGKRRRAVATDDLRKGLSYKERNLYNKWAIQFGAEPPADEYIKYVTYGRKPGSTPPPSDAILKWIKDKNIKPRDLKTNKFIKSTPSTLESLAYLFARSIGKKGIPPFPFYKQAIEEEFDLRGEEFQKAIMKEVDFRMKKSRLI